MYNNSNSWSNQPPASTSSGAKSWVQEAGYQTDRTGFGFKPQSGAAMLASLDDKVTDADAKLRDFMAEIESLEATDTPEDESAISRTQSNVPGFVSGGHVLPATAAAEPEAAVAKDEEPLVEPTTNWQHLMDANTKHYYYWNTETNSVTWTIPSDYTEYLVRHKLYREALATGRKTMPASTQASSTKTGPENDKASSKVADEEAAVSKRNEEVVDDTEAPSEIGPQLPPSLRSKLLGSSDEPLPSASTTNTSTSTSITNTSAESTDADSSYRPDSSDAATASSCVDPTKDTKPVETVAKSIGVVVGYDSDNSSEAEDPAPTDSDKGSAPVAPIIKSLVAYDDSYNINDDNEESEDVHLTETTKPLVEGPQLPSEDTTKGPQLPSTTVTTTVTATEHAANGYDLTGYSEEQYNEQLYNGGMVSYDGYDQYQYTQEELSAYASAHQHDPSLVYGPMAYGAANQDAALSFGKSQEAPLIFTGAPPPPPPPPEEPTEEDKSQGLSSMEISEYSSVIIDKLDFLDVQMRDLSKLQLLLVQLKTRLDDWQAGGLSKQYLIEKLQETDGLLEACESDSAPVGWRCNWSRKEKQYFYTHEITDELSWTYPEEDIEAVKASASQKKGEKKRRSSGIAGTLSHLTQAIEVKTVDMDLKALFLQKIVDKCTDTGKEQSNIKVDKLPPEKSESTADINSTDTNDNDSKRKTEIVDRPQKVSKAKRQHSNDLDDSEESSKHKKSKHKHKDESTDKKHKKHGKHKKNKSSSKKSKEKKIHSRSCSKEPGELNSRGTPEKYKVRSDDSFMKKDTSPDSSPSSRIRRQRLSSKIFKLDHSRARKKAEELASSVPKDQSVERHSSVLSKDQSVERHSSVLPKDQVAGGRNTTPPKEIPSGHLSLTPPKIPASEIVDLVSTHSDESKGSPSHLSPLPTNIALDPVPPVDDSIQEGGSADEMEISPQSSRGPTPEPPSYNLASDVGPKLTAVEPQVQTTENEKQPKGHIETDDDMDSFLQSIQRDMLAEKSPQKPNISAPRLPPPNKQKLPPPQTRVQLPPPKSRLELPPPKTQVELPPPKTDLESSHPTTTEVYARAAAPVLYESLTEKQPSVVTNAPVLYTAPPHLEPPVPNLVVGDGDSSPIRFPETSQPTEPAAEPVKRVKDKHKSKKSSKKSNKMPAALVQKWQKVQSEITTDIEKEQRLKSELFK